jgi:hypothetical protein
MKNKLKRGMVINMVIEKGSFAWTSGLYVVDTVKPEENELRMIRINNDFSLQLLDSGKPMISCTGLGNKGIKITKMTYNLETNEKK